MTTFDDHLHSHGLALQRRHLHTLQVNVGRKCNQACRHCHVDAAPWRTEMMDEPTTERVIAWIQQFTPSTVDITGGAPELHPQFRRLVEAARKAGCHVIDRNNLTILSEPGFEDLPEFLAAQQVEVIASLPCYLPENVAKQRGNGVFEKSIDGLRRLNSVGYGQQLELHLVYNPIGATLPPPQEELEKDYKEELFKSHGIRFNRLLALTNQPIARFAEDLKKQGQLEDYMTLLVQNFNAGTVEGLMCRTTLSVGWKGELYDCDFNQMLSMQLTAPQPLYLWDVNPLHLTGRRILTGSHCFACTAGNGSSCGGNLVAA